MTTLAPTRFPTVATAGLLCIAGAATGVLGAAVLALAPPAVGTDRYSYPLTPAGHVTIQLLFAANHLLLLGGVAGLARSGAAGSGRAGRAGLWTAAAGWILLTLCELRGAMLADSPYPAPATDVLDAAYGISTILIGTGLVAAGVAVARAGVWSGWRRWVTLACGGAVFVVVLPAVFVVIPGVDSFLVGRAALGAWMLLFAALGWAVHRAAQAVDAR